MTDSGAFGIVDQANQCPRRLLPNQFGEKFKSRVQELAALTAEAQTTFNTLFGEASAKVVETIKAKVAETTAKTAETTKKAA